MNRFQVRAAQVPMPLTWTIMLSACALATYWWVSYSGLYRVLAEFQLGHWSSYYPSYTGVVFLCLMPGAILLQIIGAIREKERSPEEAAAIAETIAARRNLVHFWLEHRRGRLTGLGVTLMLVGAGVYFAGTGLLAGKRVSVDAGALEHGERPAGRYAELTGRLLDDDAVSVTEGRRSTGAKTYIPVVSPEWRDDQPVRVYIEMDTAAPSLNTDELASGHYEGILTANSLPGLVVSSLAERGRPAPDRYWVLEYRETPAKKIELGTFMFAAAGICGLITAIGWAIAARRERASAGPPP
jgi:hypothetical protein